MEDMFLSDQRSGELFSFLAGVLCTTFRERALGPEAFIVRGAFYERKYCKLQCQVADILPSPTQAK